jgi:hypothetical protein
MATSAKDYKAQAQITWEEPLPSGATFLLKKPSVEDLGEVAGYIPATFDISAVLQKQGLVSAGGSGADVNMVDISRVLVKNCVLEPVIVTDKSLKECGEDELHIAMIDPADYAHIVRVLVTRAGFGGTPAQKSFREKPKATSRARRHGKKVRQAAEPAPETAG